MIRWKRSPAHPEKHSIHGSPCVALSGGAFNTYFPSEATCRFITGQGELDRRDNIGFRCAVSLDRLRPLP